MKDPHHYQVVQDDYSGDMWIGQSAYVDAKLV